MPGIIAAVAIALVLGAGDAAAQATCRTDALGAVVCDAPAPARPRARPPLTATTPGLRQVQPLPPAGGASPDIVPGWRQNSFGRTLVRPGESPSGGRCRTDMLGNMRCP